MGGVRIGGAANAFRSPILAVLGEDGPGAPDKYSIWKIGNLVAPVRADSTEISRFSGSYLADPSTSPDLDANGIPLEFCYCFVGAGGGFINAVNMVAWDDSSNNQVVTSPNNAGGGLGISMQPLFSPDGQRIVYRYTSAPPELHVVDRDGSNDTLVWDPSGEPSPSDVFVYWPTWNSDGTKIAFLKTTEVFTLISGTGYLRIDSEIVVMDDDGSNVTTVASKTGINVASPPNLPYPLLARPAWANTQDVVAYTEIDSSAVTDPQYVKTVNADGTGGTTILTFNKAGYSAGEYEPNLSVWSWSTDDSSLISTRVIPGDPDPKWVLMKIASNGAGFNDVSPQRRLYSYTNDYEPIIHRGRIYWNDGDVANNAVSSILENELGYRVEWDPADTAPSIFDGFRGDNITA